MEHKMSCPICNKARYDVFDLCAEHYFKWAKQYDKLWNEEQDILSREEYVKRELIKKSINIWKRDAKF